MEIVLHIFQILFILMGLGLFVAFLQRFPYMGFKGYNLSFFLVSLIEIGGVIISFVLHSWWPLLGAFLIMWGFRSLGLEPGYTLEKENDSVEEFLKFLRKGESDIEFKSSVGDGPVKQNENSKINKENLE
ncbi:hypothetical protein AKJ51_04880 [candidate division MSBL1 archaeon SCGC-AAA382A20]|uniref:Uncharacterized protein n=1 Tax=candidate division MSBL1 archaeon SCGC-AAA382A20 TaxID=1698280 RepID=A0A133VGX6_9EURY|nr:hypothetical protein AKJ51_04880 [candidate division MSBL1 archaeon SCGC-AAA382A20]